MKRICVIIVNYNTYELTKICVDSILKTTKDNVSIIVVDNASTNNSYEILSNNYELNKRVLIKHSPENRGYSAGLNYGLTYARELNADFYIFSNNDLLFKEGVIDELINTFSVFKNAGVVGGEIIDKNGKHQVSYKTLLTAKKQLMAIKPFVYLGKNKVEELDYK